MTGGLLPRKNEQKKPFRCKILWHSWIVEDDLKAIMTCKFCDATAMVGKYSDVKVPWRKRRVLCKLGIHSNHGGPFGSETCKLCGETEKSGSGGGGGC